MDAIDLDAIKEADEFLSKLRGGNTQALEIGFNKDFMIPVRLISAREEALIIARATAKAQKENLLHIAPEVLISYETMKAMLREATSFDGTVGISQIALDRMPSTELAALFDQYETIKKTINPNMQLLSKVEIDQLVEGIRQKKTRVSDCFTWQLAAIGRFCLEETLKNSPTDSAAGSL